MLSVLSREHGGPGRTLHHRQTTPYDSVWRMQGMFYTTLSTYSVLCGKECSISRGAVVAYVLNFIVANTDLANDVVGVVLILMTSVLI